MMDLREITFSILWWTIPLKAIIITKNRKNWGYWESSISDSVCESIIPTNRKYIIWISYHQGKVFDKFKDKEKFIILVNKQGIHTTTIIFKINIFKLCERHSKF